MPVALDLVSVDASRSDVIGMPMTIHHVGDRLVGYAGDRVEDALSDTARASIAMAPLPVQTNIQSYQPEVSQYTPSFSSST